MLIKVKLSDSKVLQAPLRAPNHCSASNKARVSNYKIEDAEISLAKPSTIFPNSSLHTPAMAPADDPAPSDPSTFIFNEPTSVETKNRLWSYAPAFQLLDRDNRRLGGGDLKLWVGGRAKASLSKIEVQRSSLYVLDNAMIMFVELLRFRPPFKGLRSLAQGYFRRTSCRSLPALLVSHEFKLQHGSSFSVMMTHT
ncbi:hypothetical protein NL676_008631 [Syzygium grande]|nr:hypothetical protein NL676_008631 [Syzygium grande]